MAKARKEIEEKDKLLMRDSKRARGPVTSMLDIAAMSLSLSLRMILLLPMLEDYYFLVGVSSHCLCCLHFKVYPLAWHFKGNRPVKLYDGCLFPVYVNCCVVMFTKVLICLKNPSITQKESFCICIYTYHASYIGHQKKNTKLPLCSLPPGSSAAV
jgi:glycerol-3-phosphate acyltransferase PlsY